MFQSVPVLIDWPEETLVPDDVTIRNERRPEDAGDGLFRLDFALPKGAGVFRGGRS
jgi:hypothetical protein